MTARGPFACFAASQPAPEDLLRGVVRIEHDEMIVALAAGALAPGSLAVLSALIGTTEQPAGSNNAPPITEWYYRWAAAWCAMAVSYGLAHGGFSDDGGETLNLTRLIGLAQTTAKGWAFVPYLVDDFTAAGRYHSTPQPGDLGAIVSLSHVTTIATVNGDGTVSSYEGNYSDGLYLVTRTLDAFDGFARPPWELLDPPAPPPPPPSPEPDMTTSPHILLTYGTGVVLWHSSGTLFTLATSRQVLGFLLDGCRVLDDLTDDQVAKLNGGVELVEGPPLAHLLTGEPPPPTST